MILWLLFAIVLVILSFRIYTIIFNFRCTSKVCLQGKTAIVTGGCSGIGYQIVLALASRGCKVIIADKNDDTSIRDAAVRETHNSNIVLELVNLASFKSIREFVERVKKTEDKLDILVNNAGIGGNDNSLTQDGINMITQINYYSAFLMTHLLVDLLKKSGSGRILFTTSFTSFFHGITLRNVRDAGLKPSLLHYPNSKYFQIIASKIFAEKIRDYNISSNCWHPLIVKTAIFSKSLMRDGLISTCALQLFAKLALFGKTPEEGAQTGIHLACSDDVKGLTGLYFGEGVPSRAPQFSEELAKVLWEHSEEVVKLKEEEKL